MKNKNKSKKYASWSFASLCLRGCVRLHKDDRGAISVLVLLTIWCLVAILAMVWNTTEEAMRRQQIQTAADSAAHAAGTWMSRSVNAINAQNMILCQDASTETIWRAVPPADTAIGARLARELAQAQQMKNNQGLVTLRNQMLQQLGQIAAEYQLTSDAIAVLNSGAGANYADNRERISTLNSIRQAISAMNWVENTYVNGQQPPTSAGYPGPTQRPGPPGPNGEGLAQMVANWQPSATNAAILDYIINFINTTEKPILTAFEQRTQPATSQAIDAQMAAHETTVYANETEMVGQLPETIEAQRAQLADFYKTDITLATLQNSSGSTGPAQVAAPLLPASAIPPVTGYVDSIRAAYPLETVKAGLSPVFDIDAISPQTGPAMIWHPDIPAPVDPALRAQYPGLAASYLLHSTIPDGWGHDWTAPLEQYFHARVDADAVDLNTAYMVPLDAARTGPLATAIRQMMGLPANVNIAPLPRRLPDDQPEPVLPPPGLPPVPPPPPPPPAPPAYDQVPVLPRLTAPVNSTAAYRTELGLYNQHGAAFTGAVNRLRGTLQSYTALYNFFTQAFAQDTWHGSVIAARKTVVQNLGAAKQFMVLATYGLRPLPDWAKEGMYESAELAVEDQIVRMNIRPVAQTIVGDLDSSDPSGLGSAFLDPTTRQAVLNAAYIGQATAIADAIVRPTAHQVALAVAFEWVNRPWAFEITPPSVPVPPYRGVGVDDRQRVFTVMAGARQTDATAPRLLLSSMLGLDSGKIVAYAQGETFNWMEFNANYGAAERFDQVVPTPWSDNTTYQVFIGSPRAWRVATVGGWNWHSRLSLSDALPAALQNNEELQEYMNDAGVTGDDAGALNEVNLH